MNMTKTNDITEADEACSIPMQNVPEVRAWAEKLGVSIDELTAAMGAVGPKVGDVRRFLSGETVPIRH
jgi:hypothetical protein